MYNNRSWYVLGRSSLHKSIRTFNLARIDTQIVTDKRFIGGDDFDVHEHFGKAWSMIPEGRLYNVKLRFAAKVAQNVSEVQWHCSQKVTRNNDGSATVEFRVDGLGELSWWIMGYGSQAQVLAPAALRKIIINRAEEVVRINKNI